LLDHFNAEDEQTRATRKAHRKAKRAHRPLHLSWPVGIAAVLLLGHLVALLWLHGSALAARNRDAKLGSEIREARSEIERAQKKIAALDSSPRIIEWARKRGWRPAMQADFDDVTKPATARWAVPPLDGSTLDGSTQGAGDDQPAADPTSRARVEIEVQEPSGQGLEMQREGELR